MPGLAPNTWQGLSIENTFSPPNPTESKSWAQRVPSLIALILSAFFIAFIIFANAYKFPILILKPGGADEVEPRIAIEGAKSYTEEGYILWATVTLVEEPRLFELISAARSESNDIVKRTEIFGTATPGEGIKQAQQEMADAKKLAAIFAARSLGLGTKGSGVSVIQLDPNGPAKAILKMGDVITKINGQPMCVVTDIRSALKAQVGPISYLEVTRDKKVIPIKLEPRQVSGIRYLGIGAGVPAVGGCEAKFTMRVDTAQIGGPSAGLAMTLAMIDRLSPGSLVGNKTVAITGTIEQDGSVGPVGGVKQKTFGVYAAGAEVFIVPTSEVETAKLYARGMTIIGVDTLNQALTELKKIGGKLPPNIVLGDSDT